MKAPSHSRPHLSAGFTLIECIIVIVVLAIASIGIGSLHATIFDGQSSLQDIQVRTRLMEECAENVLATRRHTTEGYAAVSTAAFGTNLCGGVTALTGYAIPTVTFTDPYTGTACPADHSCKLAVITHSGLTPLTVMLVDD